MPLAVLASSNFTDPEHERLIWLAAGGLVLLGLLLIVVTVIWWRGTKGEHAALAPLEVMGDRSFAGLTHVEQTRRLDAVRLHLEGDVEPPPSTAIEEVDLDEALRTFQPGFDDLRDEDAPAGDAASQPRLAVAIVGAADDGEMSTESPSADEPVSAEPVVVAVDDESGGDVPESAAIDAVPDGEASAPASATDVEVTGEVPVTSATADDADDVDAADDSVRTGEPVDR